MSGHTASLSCVPANAELRAAGLHELFFGTRD